LGVSVDFSVRNENKQTKPTWLCSESRKIAKK
jgi:hypothetical protein